MSCENCKRLERELASYKRSLKVVIEAQGYQYHRAERAEAKVERLREIEKWAKRWAGRMQLLHEAYQDKDPDWQPKDETVIGLLAAVEAFSDPDDGR